MESRKGMPTMAEAFVLLEKSEEDDGSAADRIASLGRAKRPVGDGFYDPDDDRRKRDDRLAAIKGRAERPDRPTGPLRMKPGAPEDPGHAAREALGSGATKMDVVRALGMRYCPDLLRRPQSPAQNMRDVVAALKRGRHGAFRAFDLDAWLRRAAEEGESGVWRPRGAG